LWAILGGGIATYLYIKSSPTPVSTGDGAILGLLAGIIGAAIYIVIGIPISLVLGNAMGGLMTRLLSSMNPSQAEAMRQQLEASQSTARVIGGGLFTALLLVVFSTIGGLLGIPIFEKRKVALAPPPPPGM
jgi:uncharacterized membrane protein